MSQNHVQANVRLIHGVISADDHVQEPPDLWTSRLSRKWGDRIPHLESTPDGGQRRVVDGQVILDGRVAKAGALLADRNQELRH